MLEIPESYTIAGQLDRTIKGKTIRNVYAGTSPHGFAFYFGDPAEYHALLAGKTVDAAKAFAGQIEIFAGDARIVLNDGVNTRYIADGEPPRKHQLLIEFGDGSHIVCTVQMYGGLLAFPDGANDNPYYIVAHQKPSPLTERFDAAYFKGLWDECKPSLSLKAFLATEQRIPGLGNGVLQDILFNARLNPKTKIGACSDADMEALFKSVKETLADMAAKGGRDTEKDLFGDGGGYKTVLSSKTLKSPCPACGGAITRQAYMGGNVYYCPECQKL